MHDWFADEQPLFLNSIYTSRYVCFILQENISLLWITVVAGPNQKSVASLEQIEIGGESGTSVWNQ